MPPRPVAPAVAVLAVLVTAACSGSGGGRRPAPTSAGPPSGPASTSRADTSVPAPAASTPASASGGPRSRAGWVYVAERAAGQIAAIRPDGSVHVVARVPDPLQPVVVPAGTPGAGTVFVTSGGHGLYAIASNGTVRRVSTQPVTTPPAVAPAGTPHAGTVYAATDRAVLELAPDGAATSATRSPQTGCGNGAGPAVAPAGTPNAGTVYLGCASRGSAHGDVLVVGPDGAARRVGTVNAPVDVPVVAPAGVPGAGTVYVGDNQGSGVTITPAGVVAPLAAGAADTVYGIAVVPAGVPGAGIVYASAPGTEGDGEDVLILGPGHVPQPLHVGADPQAPFVAPPDTPKAGTVYVPINGDRSRHDGAGNQLAMITAAGSVRLVTVGRGPQQVVVAGPGAANAGYAYVQTSTAAGALSVTVVRPSGATSTVTLSGRAGDSPALAVAMTAQRP